MIIKNILGLIFMTIGVAFTFANIGKFISRNNISSANVWLMSIGIVGTIGCFFIPW